MKLDDLKHVFKSSSIGLVDTRGYIVNLLNKFEVALTWDSRTLLIPSLLPSEESMRATHTQLVRVKVLHTIFTVSCSCMKPLKLLELGAALNIAFCFYMTAVLFKKQIWQQWGVLASIWRNRLSFINACCCLASTSLLPRNMETACTCNMNTGCAALCHKVQKSKMGSTLIMNDCGCLGSVVF
jgi:hypothetical protein